MSQYAHFFRATQAAMASLNQRSSDLRLRYRAARVGRVWAQPDNTLQATWTPPSGGSGVTQIADQLQQEGIIAHSLIFQVAARWQGKSLKAGEYEFAPMIPARR